MTLIIACLTGEGNYEMIADSGMFYNDNPLPVKTDIQKIYTHKFSFSRESTKEIRSVGVGFAGDAELVNQSIDLLQTYTPNIPSGALKDYIINIVQNVKHQIAKFNLGNKLSIIVLGYCEVDQQIKVFTCRVIPTDSPKLFDVAKGMVGGAIGETSNCYGVVENTNPSPQEIIEGFKRLQHRKRQVAPPLYKGYIQGTYFVYQGPFCTWT